MCIGTPSLSAGEAAAGLTLVQLGGLHAIDVELSQRARFAHANLQRLDLGAAVALELQHPRQLGQDQVLTNGDPAPGVHRR